MPIHIVAHPTCLLHDAGPGHPESPERVRAIVTRLQRWSPPHQLIWHDAEVAEDSALTRVHPSAYLKRLRELADQGGGRLDADTSIGAHSYDAARYAAGAAIAAARHALRGEPAFAAVRPPGHHATAQVAMGFCLVNSVVVAARYALEVEQLDRVLIVDWDVHHGNGTQDLVQEEPRIRYVSLHQWPLYPGTGRSDERGVGNIFNCPRAPGLAPSEYVEALAHAVACAIDGWEPQLILLSAGFDAMAGDPLAGFTLEPEHYAHWVRSWRGLAPIASVLEGGYAPQRIALAAEAHLRGMVGS